MTGSRGALSLASTARTGGGRWLEHAKDVGIDAAKIVQNTSREYFCRAAGWRRFDGFIVCYVLAEAIPKQG